MNGMTVSTPTDPEVAARFMGIDDYLSLAGRMISKFAPANARRARLASDDAIDFVAHKIMKGDWDYDGRAKLSTYRGYCGRRAVSYYLKLRSRTGRRATPLSLDGVPGRDAHDLAPDRDAGCPLDALIAREEDERRRHRLRDRIDGLSEVQRRCLVMRYVEGKRIREIAETLGVHRQGVYMNIKRAIQKIRDAAAEDVDG
jgi:RNA polymerase sigma factor (sigma-70 family)